MAWLPVGEILLRLEEYGVRLKRPEDIKEMDLQALWGVIDELEREVATLESRLNAVAHNRVGNIAIT